MSTNEDTILSQYTPGFRANLNLAPQQTMTKLLSTVDGDLAYDTPGQFFNADDVQQSDPEARTTRVPETPDKFIAQTRRVGAFETFDDSAWIDNVDVAAQLLDPTNKTMASLMAGRWRRCDRAVLGAAVGNAYVYTGPVQSGVPTAVALPAAQVIASTDISHAHDAEIVPADGSQYGMSVGKIIFAGAILDESELEGERYLALTSAQKADLLRRTPYTSRYYNEVSALNEGKLDHFLGFNIIRVSQKLVPTNGLGHDNASAIRRCVAWVQDAMLYRGRPITQARIRIRPDRVDTPQAYYALQDGACRRYDTAVVAIDCYEGAQY